MSDKNFSPEKVSRPLLYLLAKNSEWENENLQKVFKDKVYPGNKQLSMLFRYFILAAGISFLVCGVIFFFAYNWDALSPLQKFMVCEGAIVLCIITYMFLKPEKIFGKLLLTTAMVMTGVLFAVFGQVYQTGANAYDFFLTWALAVTLWVLVSRFLPLWLIYLTILNLVLFLYFAQVIRMYNEMYWLVAQIGLNFLAWVIFEMIALKSRTLALQRWFPRLIQFVTLFFLTIAICITIFDKKWGEGNELVIVELIIISIFTISFYTIKVRDILPLGMIGFSGIVIIVCLMLKGIDIDREPFLLLFLCLVVLGITTALVMGLYHLHKKWKNHGEEKINQ